MLVYSRSPKVGNPIASILKSNNAQGIPALFGLNPVSNFMEFTVASSWGRGLMIIHYSIFWYRTVYCSYIVS